MPNVDPMFADAGDDDELLAKIVAYYYETALKSDEVKAYLASRKLDHPELLKHFGIGYSDRTLGPLLPEKSRVAGKQIRERLMRVGLYRTTGHEHFVGALVMPIYDGTGKVVEMYGRKIGERLRAGTALHLWLHELPTGIFNVGGIEPGKALLVTGSVIDALTLWCHGFTNVVAVTGSDPAMLVTAITAVGVEQVYIAVRRTDDGDRLADTISGALAEHGVESFRVVLPSGQDVNDVARAADVPAEALGALIRQATWMRSGTRVVAPVTPASEMIVPLEVAPIATVPVVSVKSAGSAVEHEPVVAGTVPEPTAPVIDEHTFIHGDRRWRVRGLSRNPGFETLTVNLMLSCGDAFYVDSLELYSAKLRTKFIELAAVEVGLDARVVKSDLGKVLRALEALQEEAIRKAHEPKVTTVDLTDAERAEALELLHDPHLLDRVLHDFERVGVVGERTNLAVGYLAATSRLLDDPLAIVIQSTSAAGKTSLMDALIDFLPEDHRLRFSAMTGQSLYYLGASEIAHKVLAIAEEEGSAKASYALKLLQSDGGLSIASTGKDSTGRLVAHEYRVAGPVAIFTTTTSTSVDEELLNRCVILSVDEGRAQTKAIHQRQRAARTLEGILGKQEKDGVLQLHRNVQRLLRRLAVANPYVGELSFPDHRTRARRDHNKLLTLIASVTLLHQYQREVQRIERGGQIVEYIEVTRADVEMANRLADGLFRPSIDDLPPQTLRLLRLIVEHVKTKAAEADIEEAAVRFTRRELRDELHVGNTQLKIHLQRLVDLEHVLRHRVPGLGGQSVVYELISHMGYDDTADTKG